jgi:disulfide bond formation protein DsbB
MDVIKLVLPPSQVGRALWVVVGSAATLAAVWIFQALGYTPCELCLTERYAFYAAAPIAGVTALLASRSQHGVARGLFVLLTLIFLWNAGLAFYHVGVEQHWWPGPTACTGTLGDSVNVNDLMKSLNSVRVIECDKVQIRILGLSFAAWDVIASLVAAVYSALAVGLKR